MNIYIYVLYIYINKNVYVFVIHGVEECTGPQRQRSAGSGPQSPPAAAAPWPVQVFSILGDEAQECE